MRKVLVASLFCQIELLKISSAFFSAQALLGCGDLSRKKHYSNWMSVCPQWEVVKGQK